MIFKTHFSSSLGNLYEVRAANGKRLLIECGVPWRKLEEALDYKLSGIEGCLISHEHKDHCKAVYKVMRAGIKVYASAGTFEAMRVSLGRLTRVVADNVIVDMPTFSVLSFQIKHDAVEPMGYVVQDKEAEKYLLFMTDTDVFRHAFPYSFSIIALGCNFDPEILKNRVDTKDINEALALRILHNHPSTKAVALYLEKSCDLSKSPEIHLLHMSGDNLDKAAVRKEIEKEFIVTTY